MLGGWWSNENVARAWAKYRAWRNFEWYRAGHKKLVGEALREIGVLVLVFIPLEALLKYEPPPVYGGISKGSPAYDIWLHWLGFTGNNSVFAAVFFLLGLGLITVGIKVEYDAQKDIDTSEY